MLPFTIEKPPGLKEAIAAAEGGRYIAGGTTLVDLMREEVEQPRRLIDINALPLRDIHAEDGMLVIGALARMADVAAHRDVRRLQPMLAESLIEGASPQLRNMASMGGNLLQRVRCPYFRMRDAACNKRQPGSGCAAIEGVNNRHAILGTSEHCVATHPSDLAVALVALDATMTVLGPSGTRSFPVEELFRLPGETPHLEHRLHAGELVVALRVPVAAHARHARYLKVRDRQSYEFAVVSAAAALDIEGGVIRSARIACGGVGTMPWRMRASEAALAGRAPVRASFRDASALSAEGARPLGGNRFKIALLAQTIARALELAAEGSS